MHHLPRGLVHHQQIVVFVDDVDRQRFGGRCRSRRRRADLETHDIAEVDALGRPGGAAPVHEHATIGDKALHTGA